MAFQMFHNLKAIQNQSKKFQNTHLIYTLKKGTKHIKNMACAGCSVSNRKGAKDKDGESASSGCSTGGCGSTGCSTGGCNRVNTHDWLSDVVLPDHDSFDLVEISFKNGSRKQFFHAAHSLNAEKGEAVVVETEGGYDIGQVSLRGELVKLQIKKKNVKPNTVFMNVLRKANERDMEKLNDIRSAEHGIMVQARVIARALGLDMKLGDVEFQGDGRKATFFYTADGRVDFRELIRSYARDFKVKIEMRQITARSEAARIGGLGACGRELCCSTWLTDFKNVNTGAARYQNLSINQAKLSGQCGRLKCCLNYELDAYMEAFETFPKHADKIMTSKGEFWLLKTDIFKGLMFYSARQQRGPSLYRVLTTAQVKVLLERIKAGESLFDLIDESQITEERPNSRRPNNTNSPKTNYNNTSADDEEEVEEEDADYIGDVDNVVELPADKRNPKKRKRPAKTGTNAANPNANATPRPPRTEGGKPPYPKKDDKPFVKREGTPNDKTTPKTGDKPIENKQNRPPFPTHNKPKDGAPNANKPRPPHQNKPKEGDKPNSDKPNADKSNSDKPKRPPFPPRDKPNPPAA
jgi:cell fate regulator YaaT (PSP1 superfamily)